MHVAPDEEANDRENNDQCERAENRHKRDEPALCIERQSGRRRGDCCTQKIGRAFRDRFTVVSILRTSPCELQIESRTHPDMCR